MKANIFKGGRRILILVEIMVVLGFMISALDVPIYNITLETKAPDDPWRIATTDCEFDDYNTIGSYKNGEDSYLFFNLCFRSLRTGEAKGMVPYEAVEKGQYHVDRSSESSVRLYADQRNRNIQIPPPLFEKAYQKARKDWWAAFGSNLLWALVYAGTACLLLWVLARALGWVLRGFADIPTGMDRKPAPRDEDGMSR